MQLRVNADMQFLVNIFVLLDVFHFELDLLQSQTVALKRLSHTAAVLEARMPSSLDVKWPIHNIDHDSKNYNIL